MIVVVVVVVVVSHLTLAFDVLYGFALVFLCLVFHSQDKTTVFLQF